MSIITNASLVNSIINALWSFCLKVIAMIIHMGGNYDASIKWLKWMMIHVNYSVIPCDSTHSLCVHGTSPFVWCLCYDLWDFDMLWLWTGWITTRKSDRSRQVQEMHHEQKMTNLAAGGRQKHWLVARLVYMHIVIIMMMKE